MTSPQKVIKVVTPAKVDVRKRPAEPGGANPGKRPGNVPKAAAGKNQATPLPWRQRLSALPRRTMIFGGAAALVILLVVFLLSSSPREEATPKAPSKSAASLPGLFPERPADQPPQKAMTPEKEERPAIQSIRLHPPQPTRMDALKAEVVAAAYADPRRIAYTYVWKVNNRIVEGATGDTLDLSTFKKRDLVTVTVTPYEGDKAGFPVDSPLTLIHGTAPSLDLQAPLRKTKIGEPLELQLVSLHPDGDGITFSLEAPLIPGMSIDSRTGKITWIIPPNQKGTIRFGAAVEDTDKTKVTKTFDITVE
jgi:hypothetical protein